MTNPQPQQTFEIGLAGLGVMGRNLLLNMADHGFSVAGYDMDLAKVEAPRQESKQREVRGAANIQDFIALLRQPRAVVMLVPAGPPVNSVINHLLAYFQPGDLIINAGNCYFKDTDVRARIRAALLEDICAVFHVRRDLPNLLLDPNLSRKVMEHQEDLRQVVCQAVDSGVAISAFRVSLGYLDAYRSAWQPANLIQAQRDYFGSHTYEWIDAKGMLTTEWEKA